MAKFNWIRFSSILKKTESSSFQQIPSLLSVYRNTTFTLQDGLSEWKGDGFLCLAECDSKLLGIMRLDEHRTYMELSSFVVDSSCRGLGIGSKMLQQTQFFNKKIYLKVKQENEAQKLYLKEGFQIVDSCDGRYIMHKLI